MSNLRFSFGSATVIGPIRGNNEDSFVSAENLLAVADGVGGRPAGEVASATALAVVRAIYERTNDLISAVEAADDVVRAASVSNSLLNTMVTTVTAACLQGDELLLAHVGDSRAYLFQNGEFRLITEDQTTHSKLMKEGKTEDAAKLHNPEALWQAVGGRKVAQVEALRFPITSGDRLLLCTDGLSGYVALDDIRIGLEKGDPQQAADELVARALAAPTTDNVTVIVSDFE